VISTEQHLAQAKAGFFLVISSDLIYKKRTLSPKKHHPNTLKLYPNVLKLYPNALKLYLGQPKVYLTIKKQATRAQKLYLTAKSYPVMTNR